MENSLWELLSNGQSADQAVATLLEAELTGAQLSQHLMQLLVDSCGLDYVVTEEVASNVYEHIQLAADLEDLYENDNHESILQRQDIDLRSFFRNLFKAAQDSQLIEGEWYIDGYNFLRLILESDSVPADSVLKVSCAYLNALFLIPLSTTYVYIFKKNNETDNFKGILSVLAKIIKYIFSHIQKGFRYDIICEQVAQEFFDGMEKFSTLFVNRLNYLFKYERLLENHHEMINIKALMSLQKLCNNESIHEQLEAFFISASVQHTLQNLVLYKKRKLTSEVLELLSKLKNFMNDEILPQDLSNHLLLEVFSPVVKQARQAAKLIVSLDRDLWQTVVDLFVRYENDISKLKRFVDNASKWIEVIVDIPSSIELIVNNLQDTHKASTAAHIFVIVLTRLHRENLESDIVIEAIQQYPELIQKIESVQEAVAICLMFFLDLSSEDLQDVAVESSTTLINELTNCTRVFNSYWSLRRVIGSISKLYLKFGDIDNLMQGLMNELLQNFEDDTNKFFQEIPVDIAPVTLRLMLFLEEPLTALIDGDSLTRLLMLIQRLIEENDTWGPKELSLLLGLNTSIFKQFWMRFKKQEAVDVNTVELTGALIKHLDCLFLQLSKTDWEFQEAMIIFVGALELSIYFQPHIFVSIPNPVFQTAVCGLSKPKMRTLAEFLEKFLFIKKTDPETDAGFIEKRTMFDMWVTFNKSYIDFPSKTTSKCIIRYYGIDKEFTNELESLIDILQTLHPGAFAQTVAVAVMLFSIEDQFESFKKFWKCMVKRIIVKHDKQMVAVGANIMVIATCIMRQLTTHMHNCANNSNRLAILDYIVFLLKDYNINNRASLITDVFKDLGKRNDLFASEKLSFEKFKEIMNLR